MNSSADWGQTLAQAFRRPAALAHFLDWPLPEAVAATYPLLVPQRMANLIRAQGPNSALARQFLPHHDELTPDGLLDPIGDQVHAKTAQLIHRYGSRALLVPTTVCPINCRYCFRKNELQDSTFSQDRQDTLAYLEAHPEIEEVIFTGGDPLVLSDVKLDSWLTALGRIPHVKWVRFHSRVPVILPERLTPALANLLARHAQRFSKILMVVHTNLAEEWDAEARAAVRHFRPAGLEWLSQSVLLKGVNDRLEDLEALLKQLVADEIRPYYLHHPDRVRGGMHFWLTQDEGSQLYSSLRQRLPGWALPHYIIETPDGGGKIPAFRS